MKPLSADQFAEYMADALPDPFAIGFLYGLEHAGDGALEKVPAVFQGNSPGSPFVFQGVLSSMTDNQRGSLSPCYYGLKRCDDRH